MDELAGALQILSIVVIVGGVAKLAAPAAFVGMLRSLHLPSGQLLARAVGVVEVAIGAVALTIAGPAPAWLLAATFAAFTVVSVAARRVGSESCGCFGAVAAPPSLVHIAVNATAAVFAGATALAGGTPTLASTVSEQPVLGIAYLITLATGVWLVVTLDTHGARVVEGIRALAPLGDTFRSNAPGAAATTRRPR